METGFLVLLFLLHIQRPPPHPPKEVVPHPGKARLHGGRFGPEAGALALPAYALGLAMLVAFYGTGGLARWAAALGGGMA